MAIDAHQHFWDPARADYPWMMAPELAPIRRAFGPADLAPLLKANGIDASILVQCRSSLAETEEFLGVAHATPSVIGVVGWTDLTDAALGDTIDRLRALPGGAHYFADEPYELYKGGAKIGEGVTDEFGRVVIKDHEAGTPAYQIKLANGAKYDLKVKDALHDDPDHADQRTNRGERLS